MKRFQWITFGVIFLIGSGFLFILAFGWNSTCSILSSTMVSGSYDATTASTYTACVIKAQSYFIPGFILFLLYVAFSICAILEKKK